MGNAHFLKIHFLRAQDTGIPTSEQYRQTTLVYVDCVNWRAPKNKPVIKELPKIPPLQKTLTEKIKRKKIKG